MRKITVLSMITLDGVMQAPGGPKEDRSGGFKYGGWTAPYGDKVFNKVIQEELKPADYILGRKTFGIWAGYWPKHGYIWPGINKGTKYVISKKLKKTDPLITGWDHSVLIKTVADIKKIKQGKGRDIHVWGSSRLIQTLLKNDLVDELRLKIYPILLGQGKKLFDDGTIPAAFTLVNSIVTPKGVIITHYKRPQNSRDRKVKTGNLGD
jgi:dihydrofolate reductase